ncbi:hypothetical protein OEZ85_012057 [Tetradesmus obliquus]|uniref:Uncharacterized protein n=1 Tax=Tetradesmus obliquus TaxID=3088 RepID=A0ABY8TSK8_TETOB|nr:hypothetical protein OEZ85_012057 [Tetradesmus obliquus]
MADTRRSILHTIRDQAKLRHSSTHSQQHPYLQVWTPQQWWESFQFLFINHLPPPDSAHHDDLLFFSKSPSHPTASNPPFFVRRKAKQLPEELQLSGSQFSHVDWAQTVLLNIVLQSQYQLTVVACGREALPFVAEGRTWSPNMITVSKPVYASTTVTAVNLDSSRAEASNPQPCYPDICFAVDNFDNAFQELVLEDADKCYCVVLHAVNTLVVAGRAVDVLLSLHSMLRSGSRLCAADAEFLQPVLQKWSVWLSSYADACQHGQLPQQHGA